MILSRWRKEVRHILPLSSCGVSDTPLQDESHRESLIREIYLFLNQNVTSLSLSLSSYMVKKVHDLFYMIRQFI